MSGSFFNWFSFFLRENDNLQYALIPQYLFTVVSTCCVLVLFVSTVSHSSYGRSGEKNNYNKQKKKENPKKLQVMQRAPPMTTKIIPQMKLRCRSTYYEKPSLLCVPELDPSSSFSERWTRSRNFRNTTLRCIASG